MSLSVDLRDFSAHFRDIINALGEAFFVLIVDILSLALPLLDKLHLLPTLLPNIDMLVRGAAIRAQILQHQDFVFLQLGDFQLLHFQFFVQLFDLHLSLCDLLAGFFAGSDDVHGGFVHLIPIQNGYMRLLLFRRYASRGVERETRRCSGFRRTVDSTCRRLEPSHG